MPPGPWEAHEDPRTKKTYYHNTETGETVWHKPPGFDSLRVDDSDSSGSDIDPIVESDEIYQGSNRGKAEFHSNPLLSAVEERRGNELDNFDFGSFHDELEKKKREETAAERAAMAAVKAKRKSQRKKRIDAMVNDEEDIKKLVVNIGKGWHSNVDKNTGRTYYANIHTKEVTWEWPKEVPREEESKKPIVNLSQIYGQHVVGPNENRKKKAGTNVAPSTLIQRKSQKKESGSSKYFAKLEARIKHLEASYDKQATHGIEKRVQDLEDKHGIESESLERRRGLLFFGLDSLHEDNETIIKGRRWQRMTYAERIAETKMKAKKLNLLYGIGSVLGIYVSIYFHKVIFAIWGCGANDEMEEKKANSNKKLIKRRTKRRSIEEWIAIAGPGSEDDDGRLNWNVDLHTAAIKKQQIENRRLSHFNWGENEGGMLSEDDDAEENLEVDMMDGDTMDNDPGDPCKYEETNSMHILTMYACNKVFSDERPMPQQWKKAKTFVGYSYFCVLMQIYTIFRMVELVALQNDGFYGIAGFPVKRDIHFANNIAVPRFRQRYDILSVPFL